MRHYGLNNDVNSVLLMADIVLYGSSQVEQGFPSLIIRAMTFGIPVIIPDFPIIKKHVSPSFFSSHLLITKVLGSFVSYIWELVTKLQVIDGVNVMFYQKHNPEDLMRAFSLFISNGRLSKFSRTVALSGRLLAKNMLASDCVTGYARLLENVLNFPSDALLPGPISQLQQASWEWNLFREEMERGIGDIPNVQQGDYSYRNSSVYVLEKEFANLVDSMNLSENENQSWAQDSLTEGDWDVLRDLENFEEYESLERQEV